jgi:APA family basic amino acid/polyamine antiporter
MNVAYLWVFPIDVMGQSKLVAADVAEKIVAGGGRWVAVLVMVSTLGAANAIILTTARAYYAMARDGAAPRFLARVHPRYHTPGASLVVQGVWSVLLLFSGTFDTLTDTLIFVTWIFYVAGAYGVFVMRRKIPLTRPSVTLAPSDGESAGVRGRSYVVPGYPVVPWVFIGFALIFLVLTAYHDVESYRAAVAAGKPAIINSVFGVTLVLVGAPIYWLGRRNRPAI